MTDDTRGALDDQERAELERLRAEKAVRERADRDARERAELERLRADHERALQEQELDAHTAAARERGRRLMEPDAQDEDLRMPVGQKVVLVAIALVALAIVLALAMGR